MFCPPALKYTRSPYSAANSIRKPMGSRRNARKWPMIGGFFGPRGFAATTISPGILYRTRLIRPLIDVQADQADPRSKHVTLSQTGTRRANSVFRTCQGMRPSLNAGVWVKTCDFQ